MIIIILSKTALFTNQKQNINTTTPLRQTNTNNRRFALPFKWNNI